MAIDIYHTRRTHYERCPFYNDTPERGLEEWVLKTRPTGIVYCQPVDRRNLSQNQVNNIAMFDKDAVVLKTSDDSHGIKKGTVILYSGHPWIVDSVSQEIHLKESEFGHNHYDSYIYLRR